MFTLKDIGKAYRFPRIEQNLYGDTDGLVLTKYQDSSEAIVNTIYEKLGDGCVYDVCAGIGGLTIFLIQKFKKVISVEQNPERCNWIKINAKNFGLKKQNNLMVMQTSAFSPVMDAVLDTHKPLAVVIDPGFRDDNTKSYEDTTSDLSATIPNAIDLFNFYKKHTENIVLHAGPKTNKEQLESLGSCRIEEFKYNNNTRYLIAYYGDLI